MIKKHDYDFKIVNVGNQKKFVNNNNTDIDYYLLLYLCITIMHGEHGDKT